MCQYIYLSKNNRFLIGCHVEESNHTHSHAWLWTDMSVPMTKIAIRLLVSTTNDTIKCILQLRTQQEGSCVTLLRHQLNIGQDVILRIVTIKINYCYYRYLSNCWTFQWRIWPPSAKRPLVSVCVAYLWFIWHWIMTQNNKDKNVPKGGLFSQIILAS